jgi:hypothetical protein
MLLGPDMVLKYEVLVFMLIAILKLFDDKHQVVFKLIHKTLKSAFFNHHLFHHQAHSSSKKCAHLNHHHHHLFASNNKHHLFHNLLHLFFVNDHHNHQLHKLHKQLSANLLLYPYHHDRSSLNVSHLPQLDHVISSSNVGFLMVLPLNEKQLFKELKQPKVILPHVTSSFNTNKFKSVLFDNFNAWVLLKKVHKHTFNVTELNYLMLKHFFNKLVLPVLLKIYHHQLVLAELALAHRHLVKKDHSVPVVPVELNSLVSAEEI